MARYELHPEVREQFDEELEAVLGELPEQVHALLEEVPLVVDDFPSAKLMKDLDVEYPDDLCGLYTGVPLTERTAFSDVTLPDAVTIFRSGILRAAAADDDSVDLDELRHQIRITILHEVGHHFGLSEDDLAELGYD